MKKNTLLFALCAVAHISAAQDERAFVTVPWQYIAVKKQTHDLLEMIKKNTQAIDGAILLLPLNNHLNPATIEQSQRLAGAQSHHLLEELNASLRKWTKRQKKILADLESRAKTSDRKTRMSGFKVPAAKYPWTLYNA